MKFLAELLWGAVVRGDKRGAPTILLDHFAHGYLFALAMAGVRFAFGH